MQGNPNLRARHIGVTRRVAEITIAAVGLVSLAPALVLVGCIVALDTRSPPICWQHRLGPRGRRFAMLKFRTMGAAYDPLGRRRPDIERISIIGWLLRHTGLERLPQLCNIIAGHMSLFSPEPPFLVDALEAPNPGLMTRTASWGTAGAVSAG